MKCAHSLPDFHARVPHPAAIWFVALAFSLLALSQSPAAVRTWDGSASALWSNSGNWTPSGVPVDGDTLIFPAGALNPLNTNNIADLRLDQIQFNGAAGGFVLRGNAITLTNGVVAAHTAGVNALDFANITNAVTQTYLVESGGTLDVNANVVLIGGFTLTINNDFVARLDGAISGTGNLLKTSLGTGTLAIGGTSANTFNGTVTVNGGLLQLGKANGIVAVPGDLVIAAGRTVTLLTDDQIGNASDVTIGLGGTLNLNNQNDTIGTLTLTGATVSTGTGTLTNGNITTLTSASSSIISGRLHLGTATRTFNVASGTAADDLTISAVISGGSSGSFPLISYAGIIKSGPGSLLLSGANTYSGLTTVNEGRIDLRNDEGLGGTFALFGNAGTVVNSNAALLLNNAHVTNEVLTLNSVNTGGALQVNATGDWVGDVRLSTNVVIEASSLLRIGGQITGVGGFTKIGGSTLHLFGTTNNIFEGDVTVNSGTLELAVSLIPAIPDTAILTIHAATVRHLVGNQIGNAVDVFLTSGGSLLDLNNFSDNVGQLSFTAGTITTGTGLLTPEDITVNASPATATISGRVNLDSLRDWTVADGGSVCDFTVDAVISGVGGIRKHGPGALCLNGVNTYADLTIVTAGSLNLAVNDALGATGVGTVVSNGAAIFLDLGVNTLREVLTLNGPGVAGQGALYSIGLATIQTNLVLGSDTIVTVATNGLSPGSLTVSGGISGTGSLTKQGIGTLIYSGSPGNTYAGATRVNEGTLVLDKSALYAIPSGQPLIIGDGIGGLGADVVRYQANNMINSPSPILVNGSGLLDLNGFTDLLGQITLIGGDIDTGSGAITMANSMFATSESGNAALIKGNLSLGAGNRTFFVTNGPVFEDLKIEAQISGSGGIIKAESGFLTLSASNTFSGPVTLQDGTVRVQDSFALGSTAGGTAVIGDSILQLISNVHVGTEALTLSSSASAGALESLSGSNSWAGDITLTVNTVVNVDPGDTLNLLGAIGGAGGLTKIDTGTLYFSGAGANTYAGTTRVNAGTLVLAKSVLNTAMVSDLVVGDGFGGVNADVVRTQGAPQLPNTVGVTVNSSGLLEFNAEEFFGSLAGSGNVLLNSVSGMRAGYDNTSTLFSGVISGVGLVGKNGVGTMTFTGNNAYTGQTEVAAGRLIVDGNQPQSAVSVAGSGVLGGSGTVGVVFNGGGGTVAPGASPGILTTSNLVSSAALVFELNGPAPGTGFDQLNVRGTNNISGSPLSVSVSPGFAPVEGQPIVILENDGAEPIVGTFAGLPEGGIVTAGTLKFRVSYVGGTGNDISLTLVNPPLDNAGATVLTGNGNNAIDPNECNLLFLAITNTTGAAVTGISAELIAVTDHVLVTQPYSPYPDLAVNARGTNVIAFQLTTLPTFPCGTNVNLLLKVSSSAGSFATAITVPSGLPGTALRFNNNANLAIPDSGSITSSVAVAGIATPIQKVRVALHLTHPSLEDMDIFLESPDGTRIALSTDNGGTGDDYGTDCIDASRTFFDDAAPSAITSLANSAPYVGVYRPEQALAAFIGKSGAAVNGSWKLVLGDDTAGSVGTLRCWSLFISPTACAAGSGVCELCPEIVVNGSMGAGLPTQPTRLLLNGIPSTCGAPKPCPGPVGVGPWEYQTFAFQNGPSNSCITVSVDATGASVVLIASAYLNSFDPLNLCQNYLGDYGSYFGGVGSPVATFKFDVPASANFVVVLAHPSGSTGTGFKLTATGGDCRPVLNIAQTGPSSARLSWSTAAAGYKLTRTTDLETGPVWPAVDIVPSVVGGDFEVNDTMAPTNTFYRLSKP